MKVTLEDLSKDGQHSPLSTEFPDDGNRKGLRNVWILLRPDKPGCILKMECEGFEWIHLAHITDQWLGSCNLCSEPYVPINVGEFLDQLQGH